MVTWGKFQTLEGKVDIILYNTHLDHQSEMARKYGAKLIWDCLSLLEASESYLFLTGDFNANPETEERKTMLQPFNLQHYLKDALAGVELSQQMSFHDFTDQPFLALDTI
jgi:endonuclease/exonuclease/phosphatase family metal-dependent hydrolase